MYWDFSPLLQYGKKHSEILPPLKEKKFLSTIITIWRSLCQNGIETSTMKNSDNLQRVLFGMICDTAPATCCISPNCEDIIQTKNNKKKRVFSTNILFNYICVINSSAINNEYPTLLYTLWFLAYDIVLFIFAQCKRHTCAFSEKEVICSTFANMYTYLNLKYTIRF